MLSCGLSLKATQSPLRLVLSGKLWESSGTVALTDREVMAMWRHTTKFNPSQIPNASYETTPWVPGLLSGSQCQTVVGWWVMSSGVVHYPSLSGIIISDTYVWIMIYIYINHHYPSLSALVSSIYIYIYWGLWEFPETNEYNPGWGSESSESANLSDKCHRCSSQVDNHWVCPKKEYTMIYHKMGYTMVYPGPTQQSY
jgi:hypothetical protein